MKTKKNKKILVILLILSLAVSYGTTSPYRNARAVDSITNAQDLISDSDPYQVATHTFTFTTGTTTPEDGFWSIIFPSAFTTVGNGTETCGYGSLAASTSNQIVDCIAGVGGVTPTSTQVIVTGVTNPSNEGTQYIEIRVYGDDGEMRERVRVAVAIISDVLLTARVDSTLDFDIYGVASGQTVNGINCDQTSTATSVPFGTLSVLATTTVCQRLTVSTNADDGFVVTVWQDHELQSDSGSNINSFNNSENGTGSTTPQIWQHPRNVLDHYNTYGHMGLTSNDDDDEDNSLMANDYFQGGNPYYVGLNGTDPTIIMAHTGPSDAQTQNKGVASVAYSAQIASLQEAGDYENTVTYICTPTY